MTLYQSDQILLIRKHFGVFILRDVAAESNRATSQPASAGRGKEDGEHSSRKHGAVKNR